MIARVLSIAGTDPSGGAGLHADLKSIAAAGGYGMAAVTSIVSQNTHGVAADILHLDPRVVRDQLDAVATDVKIDAVKLGMLGSVELIEEVSDFLRTVDAVVVLDPVMVASSGDALLGDEARAALVALCEQATVVTPNIPELEILTGSGPITSLTQALEVASHWAVHAGVSVVVKAGHLSGDDAGTYWVDAHGVQARVPARRLHTTNTHGTGCSLSSALATRLVNHSPADALRWATEWVHESIAAGAELKVGTLLDDSPSHGPIDHGRRARMLGIAGHQMPEQPALNCEPLISPAGPGTAAMWSAGEGWLAASMDCEFVRTLADGTLAPEDFTFYLAQDAAYLGEYSLALRTLGERTGDKHWLDCSAEAERECAELHARRLGGRDPVRLSRTNQAYTDFLLARCHADDPLVGMAAVLPCFWLYAELGKRLTPENAGEYADWVSAYRDDSFAEVTGRTLEIVERAWAGAEESVREAATQAFVLACRYEYDFWLQAFQRREP
ncbi:bifunctional hydroxymethylpyrimidine kinase/phosphomethylpyrimidine kinase [Corynebacterium tapiri]|uniref:Bifunctional hydroxymethylpyrimidine kinase/phosphomethylpyrimidine kinase n=1 Tax=Corynebacterium tapiri TaxID=1448266 RepID=A0A5C4U4K8_9CORY|nr:bifunctional hydroxymethylpyrimidine kinase/phosphomethylpyrimidine kinase [Corynebacterium tapiri]TNL98592.1 bifunctional hydroxymethylpyrimidine kinase/phosphomethylpyrimidine kinase [Corynebacterium tapiri]